MLSGLACSLGPEEEAGLLKFCQPEWIFSPLETTSNRDDVYAFYSLSFSP